MSKESREAPEVRLPGLPVARAAVRGVRLLRRADQVVRGGIWAVSVVVIAVYVLTSFSRPGPTLVTTSTQSPSRELPSAELEVVAGEFQEAMTRDSGPAAEHTLARWTEPPGAWLPISLDFENSADYRNESAPLLLRIGDAIPGRTYTLTVRHDCAHLAAYDRGGPTPTLYEEGPGSSTPDALLTAEDGTFKLWGGIFASAEAVPSAVDLCLPQRGAKANDVDVIALDARSDTLHVIWDSRLASPIE